MVGDGGFLMTGNEMIAAVQHKLPVVFILSNNNCYASIRINQEHEYPGRVSGTSLLNPDFRAMAAAFGIKSLVLDNEADIDRLVGDALAAMNPCSLK